MEQNKKKVLGIIPARGGSKRLPAKNIMLLRGKPLLAWTIEAGLASGVIDRLIISTDDPEISKVALEYGCEVPFLRPPEFSTDEATSVDVVLHALSQTHGFTHFILLQPTSPLRRANHIVEAFELMCASGASACVSMRRSLESPYWMFKISEKGFIAPVVRDLTLQRKQVLPEAYLPNGAIIIGSVEKFQLKKSFYGCDTIPYIMSSTDSIDIDTFDDFKLAESSF